MCAVHACSLHSFWILIVRITVNAQPYLGSNEQRFGSWATAAPWWVQALLFFPSGFWLFDMELNEAIDLYMLVLNEHALHIKGAVHSRVLAVFASFCCKL